MIITALARHAGQSLRLFLDALQADVILLRLNQQQNYISRAKIDGLNLVEAYNISFLRLGHGRYRFDFEKPYKTRFYSVSIDTGGFDVLIVHQSREFIEIQSLKDIELSIICVGDIS